MAVFTILEFTGASIWEGNLNCRRTVPRTSIERGRLTAEGLLMGASVHQGALEHLGTGL